MIDVGDTAPDFSLPAVSADAFETPRGDKDDRPADRTITLSQYRGRIDVLLMFYPLDWSPVCSSEHVKCVGMFPTFSARLQVLGISVDSIWSHRAFANAYHIAYPLLSDFQPRGAVARQYGVYLSEFGFAARTSFLLDKFGRIRLIERAAVPEERRMEAVLNAAPSA
jgi:peroxiredoxin